MTHPEDERIATNGYKSVLEATEDERIAEEICRYLHGKLLDDLTRNSVSFFAYMPWAKEIIAIARNLRIVDASSQPLVDSSVSKESLHTDTRGAAVAHVLSQTETKPEAEFALMGIAPVVGGPAWVKQFIRETDTVPVPAGVWKIVVDAVENYRIAAGMGWDLEGVDVVLTQSLAAVRDIEGGV